MTTVIENDQNIQNSPCVEAKGFARIRPSRSGLTGGASGAGCRHGLGPEQACPTCEGRSYAKSASQLDFMERGPETEDVPPGRMRRALPEQSGAPLHDLGAESRIWLAENCTRDTKAHHSSADKQTIRENKMPSNLMPGINEMRAGTIEFGDPPLGGRLKTGQLGSLQNRPTVWPRTWSLFIPFSPDQASPFWFSSSVDRTSGCVRGGVDGRAWR